MKLFQGLLHKISGAVEFDPVEEEVDLDPDRLVARYRHFGGTSNPAGYQTIRIEDPGRSQPQVDAAKIEWRTCERCGVGVLVKISVGYSFHRQGLASLLVQHVIAISPPDLAWSVTSLNAFSRPFMAALEKKGSPPFARQGGPRCAHEDEEDQDGAGRRPGWRDLPVLTAQVRGLGLVVRSDAWIDAAMRFTYAADVPGSDWLPSPEGQ